MGRTTMTIARPRLAGTNMLLFTLSLLPAGTLWAEIPSSGPPVPEFNWISTHAKEFMEERSITGGVVGIMRNDVIVFLKGFGEDYYGNDLPENTPMRLASVSKPVAAAALQHLIANSSLSADDFVLNLGQAGGGILNIDPFPELGDDRMSQIRVRHLIEHSGGWDATAAGDDFAFHDIACAEDMGINSPPSRWNKLRWILGKPLQFTPGSEIIYSNINYHFIHEIIEQRSGITLEQYVKANILTPVMWVPHTEHRAGAALRSAQDPREPRYVSAATSPSVYFPLLTVSTPYGGWHLQTKTGYGGYVATAATMLEFANRYRLDGTSQLCGRPLADEPLEVGVPILFNGSLDGTNTSLYQLRVWENVHMRIFVGFNRRYEGGEPNVEHWGQQFVNSIVPALIGGFQVWPTAAVDGFWTSPPAQTTPGLGGYHRPFNGMAHMLSATSAGSRIRMLPGTSNWTGVIDRSVVLDAPEGTAIIGQQ